MTELLFNATSVAPSSVSVNDEAVNDLSPGARRLLNEFPSVPEIYMKQVVAPPGLAGEFVRAAMSASHRPFLKFAIPATLAVLSGIVGRRYKMDNKDGDGTAINVILAAVSNAGKSDIIEAWRNFCWMALLKVYPNGTAPQRIHSHTVASVQALTADLSNSPAGVWSVEEAKAMIDALMNPKTTSEQTMADSFRSMWDSSKHIKTFSAPRSIRGRQDGEKPIRNISLSTFLALPFNELVISDDNSLDGVLSRILVIRHKGSTVPLKHNVQRKLPDDLNKLLIRLLVDAGKLDELYDRDFLEQAYEQLVPIDFSQVAHIHQQFADQVDEYVRKGQDEGTVYVALGRLHVFVKRIAGTLAVVENPNDPKVTIDQYNWSFGYVLQNFASILSDFDTGDIGDMASDEEEAVKRAIRDMLKKNPKWRKIGGVPKKELRDKIKHRAPFSAFKAGKGQVITKVIDDMLANGVLVVVEDSDANKVGRKPMYFALSETP